MEGQDDRVQGWGGGGAGGGAVGVVVKRNESSKFL